MAAIKSQVVAGLKEQVTLFGWRMAQLVEFKMTHDECLHLLAPAWHHELLKTAADVAQINASYAYMTVEIPYEIDGIARPTVDITMRTHGGKDPPLNPKHPKWHACDPAIQRKVIAWAENYFATTRMAATTKWVIDQLAEMCDTGHQVRYLWPAVLHLASKSGHDEVEKWSAKYGVRVAPRNMPMITPAFRKILADTSQWCAQAAMLDEIKQQDFDQVTIAKDRCIAFDLKLQDMTVSLVRDNI